MSVFLVNETEVTNDKRPGTFDYLFQPQIRVHLVPGTFLLPVQIGSADIVDSGLASEAEEEKSTTMRVSSGGAGAVDICVLLSGMKSTRSARNQCGASSGCPFYWTDTGAVPDD